jgi:hypothetical protein
MGDVPDEMGFHRALWLEVIVVGLEELVELLLGFGFENREDLAVRPCFKLFCLERSLPARVTGP